MGAYVLYKKKDGMHFVVRTMPCERAQWSWSADADLSDELNSLITAKSLDQLMMAINAMPPLVPCEYFGSRKVIYSVVEFCANPSKGFSACDSEKLRAEAFLESARLMRSNKTSMGSFIEKWGTDEDSLIGSIKGNSPEDAFVVVEPLQDWMMLRNSLSVCARPFAALESGGEVDFGSLGFERTESKRLKDRRMYALPFKYNSFYSKTKVINWEDQDPLNFALTNLVPEKVNIPLQTLNVFYLNESDKSAFFLGKPTATNEYGSLLDDIQKKHAAESPIYFCVDDSGDSVEMAKNIVSSFAHAFRNLVVPQKGKEGVFCGWEYDKSGEFEQLPAPRLAPRSYASALFYQLIYHPSKKLSLCKWCGGALMSHDFGPRKEFCSGGCRVQHGRKYPGGGSMNPS